MGLEGGKGRVGREGSDGDARCAVALAVPLRFERVAARPILASVSPVARACLAGFCLMGGSGGRRGGLGISKLPLGSVKTGERRRVRSVERKDSGKGKGRCCAASSLLPDPQKNQP